MYSRFQLARKYLRYWLTSSNGRGHGIHSPFVFDLITRVLRDKRHFYAFDKIEFARLRLKADHRVLPVEDFGAGSASGTTKERKISAIAAAAAKSPRLAQLLFRIANHYQPGLMIELGTSLGISAAYLAMGNQQGKLISFEGAPAVLQMARENFHELGIRNIDTIAGNFDDTLPPVLAANGPVALAFIDGNHRKAPTLRYFKQLFPHLAAESVLIFDDIHWSKEMEEAWNEIKSHESVMLTVDVFFMGLVFFNPSFKVKQEFVIRF